MSPSELRAVAARARAILAEFRAWLGLPTMALMLGSALLVSLSELAGLALIFPFLKLVSDPAFHGALLERLQGSGLEAALAQPRQAITAAGAGLLGFYALKGALHAWLVRFQAATAAELNRRASCELIDRALGSRYQLFQEHGAVKVAGVSYSNTTHAALLFQALVSAANELLLLGFVFAGMLALSPGLSLGVLGGLGAAALLFFLPLSRRVAAIGRRAQAVDLARHRFVFAMASAIRDIKIMGLEAAFIARNRAVVDEHAGLSADYSSIGALQRIAVEVLMVAAVVLGCVWLGRSGADLVALAPTLVTLGLVAVRAAPSLTRLSAAYSGFRYSLPFVEALLQMRAEVERYPQAKLDDAPDFSGAYEAQGLGFAYGDKAVLRGVSLSIPRGHVVAIVGPSGSGKSTLLDLLAGLQPPSQGSFRLSGAPFEPFRSRGFSRRIGYVPQSIALLDASLAYNIALEEQPDPRRLDEAVRKAHLGAFVAGLPQGLGTLLGEGGQGVSGGQRQRIGIARALYREPALLILDEVTSALDPETEAAILRELLQLRGQASLLMVTHKLDTVRDADVILRLEDGRLA